MYKNYINSSTYNSPTSNVKICTTTLPNIPSHKNNITVTEIINPLKNKQNKNNSKSQNEYMDDINMEQFIMLNKDEKLLTDKIKLLELEVELKKQKNDFIQIKQNTLTNQQKDTQRVLKKQEFEILKFEQKALEVRRDMDIEIRNIEVIASKQKALEEEINKKRLS